MDHVQDLGWKGKKDCFLLPDASGKGYDALITNDSARLDSAEETRAIRESGMHHIRYRHDTRRGIDGLALAMAAVMAAIRPVVRESDDADGQRLVEIQAILPTRRYEIIDPPGQQFTPVPGAGPDTGLRPLRDPHTDEEEP